jgi:hypothetical protein
MSTSREELDAAIERAISALDVAIIENRLYDDPLRLVLVGLIQTLRAQQRLHAAASQDMAGHLEKARVYLEDARQPVRDEELQRAVTRGVGAHAINMVASIRLGTVAGLAAAGLVLGLIGFGLGGWWQYDRMAAQVDRMAADVETQDKLNDRIMVEAKELGSVVLSARSAAMWTELVQRNPNVAEAFRDCQPMKVTAGSACSLPVWTMPPPPPKMATPATH